MSAAFVAACDRCGHSTEHRSQGAAVRALRNHPCQPAQTPKPAREHVPARERTPFGQFQLRPSHLKTEIPGAAKFTRPTDGPRVELPAARPAPRPSRRPARPTSPEPPAAERSADDTLPVAAAFPPPEVLAHGLCAQADPEAWFPDKGGSTRAAKAICNGDTTRPPCPVRDECLAWALANNERFGIWGGMSERERRRLNAEQVAS